MRAEYLNPFIQAACTVLRAETGTPIGRENASLVENQLLSDDVSVVIAVTGNPQGLVLYNLSEKTAKQIAGAMLGEPVPVWTPMAESSIAEVGNMITGLASGELERVGYRCRISPPSVVTGRGSVISTFTVKRLVLPIVTSMGKILIHLALRESAEPSVISPPDPLQSCSAEFATNPG